MTQPDRRLDVLRRLAWACVVLMLVVTSVSAWLRLAAPRPNCNDWPACRGELQRSTPHMNEAGSGQTVVMGPARITHRVSATLVLLIVVAMGTLALARRPRLRIEGRQAVTLLALALGLSALGVITPGSRAAAVLLGNLLGGFLMLALAWRLVGRLQAHAPVDPVLARFAQAGAWLWAAQAALGAASGFGLLAVEPIAHVALALVAGPWAYFVGAAARRQGRTADGASLMTLAVLQILLGGAGAMFGAPAVLLTLHNAGAAIGFALLFGLNRGTRG